MRRAIVIVTTLASSLVVLSATARAAPAITARQVIGGLKAPVAFTFGPRRTIWYVEKDTGQVRIHDLRTGEDSLFLDVSGVNGNGERGMLGIALHPRYPDTPYVYVYATRSANGHLWNQVLRITDERGSGSSPKVIFSSRASSSPYHNGGRILFGPDDMLYAVVGDGHDPSNAQDLSDNDLGKILRMTPTGGVPTTNPRDGSLMYAFGIRNSFGFAFDPQTDALWETENGPECNDEVNLIRSGANYGWGPNETCAGSSPGNTNQDGADPVRPKLFYEATIGITGIAFCDGCGLGSSSDGRAFFGAVNDGSITRVALNAKRTRVKGRTVVYTHPSGVLSMEVGAGGYLYFSDVGGIYRLVRS